MDTVTPQQRSRMMSRIRSRDTRPELIVRRWLWSRGYRYRKNYRGLPGTPDIVLKKYGTVIFVHGCFWHGHDTHLRVPKTRTEYWAEKIRRNRERDQRVRQKLKQMGWSVMVVWECQLHPSVRERTLREIEWHLNRTYLSRRYGASELPIAAEPPAPYGDVNLPKNLADGN